MCTEIEYAMILEMLQKKQKEPKLIKFKVGGMWEE